MQNEKQYLAPVKYGVLGICILFFLTWLFFDGIKVAVDTASYVNFDVTREPLYPTILAMFRFLFGGASYFWWVGAFQCILTGYAVWKVSDVLSRIFHLGFFSTGAVLFFQIAVCMMTRFLAGRKTLYCLAMETEGLAIPLFLLFFIHLFSYLANESKRELVLTYLYAFLLILLRKQMFITLIIMGVMWFLSVLRKKLSFKRFVVYTSLLAGVVALTGLTERTYNYAVHGRAIERTTDVTMLIPCLFAAQPQDAAAIADESLKEVFLEMLSEIERQGWGYENAPDSLWGLQEFYADNYDNISYKVLKPTLRKYVAEKEGDDYLSQSVAFDQQVEKLLKSTAFQNMGRKIKILSSNLFCGLMNTVAKNHRLLVGYTIGICLLFIAFLSLNGKKPACKNETILGELVLVSVLINIGVVALMIFTQSRYMIYNMPLFYIALYLMLRGIILNSEKGLVRLKKWIK